MHRLFVGSRPISLADPVYFVADISANHDGNLDRAKLLVRLAKEAGADAAKFQNFRAPAIVSPQGFASLGAQRSHQAKWKKSVYDVYVGASLPSEWTPILKAECERAGIEYFSTPYDFESLDMLDPHVRVYKIGSGDITWLEMIERVVRKGKPVFLAAGASSIGDVQRAMDVIRRYTRDVVLMQCNTNYTASFENFRYIHLNVLKSFATTYPEVVLGLSDHTPGHATVLGAVALGARVVEKHLTDDTSRDGPDHPFSMDPASWSAMVARTRELELALGSPEKRVEENERDSVIVQQRCIRANQEIPAGATVERDMLAVLRPAPDGSIRPYEIGRVLGMRARVAISTGTALTWGHLESGDARK